MIPWRKVRFKQLKQTLQRALVLMKHLNGVAAVIASIVIIHQQVTDFMHQRGSVRHGNQAVGLLQFAADIGPISTGIACAAGSSGL